MDMYNAQTAQAVNNHAETHPVSENRSALRRFAASHWGIALICGLIAAAICVSALHTGHAESRAMEVPEAEVESVSVLPLN